MSDVIEAATEWLAALKIDSEASADARVDYEILRDLLADLAAAQAVIAETIAHHDFRSVPTRGDDYDIVCACGYISLDGENDVCPTVRLLAQSPADALAADRARVRVETLAEVEAAIIEAAPPLNAELSMNGNGDAVVDPGMAAYVEGFHDVWSTVRQFSIGDAS